MEDVLGTLISGLILGCQYALFAAGLSLILGSMKILNLAHPVLFVAGGYVVYFLADGAPATATVVLGIVLVGGILGGIASGYLLEISGFTYLRRRSGDDMAAVLFTVGFTLAAVEAIGLVVGTEPRAIGISRPVITRIGPATLTATGVLTLAATAVVFLGLYLALMKTDVGLRLRAVADAGTDAELVGINSSRVARMAVLIAGGLAGLGGALYTANLGSIHPALGEDLLVKGAAIVIVGGMGSMGGAILVAMLLAIGETFTVVYAGSYLREAIALSLLLGVLIFRPIGLFGRPDVVRA